MTCTGMLYILYQDDKGENRFDAVAKAYSPGFDDEWRRDNPTRTLIAVLDADADLTAKEQNQRLEFNINCGAYGFRPVDYLARIALDGGATGRLIGFNPRNRKYPCIIQPARTGQKRVKATPDYVRRNLCDAAN